MPVVLVTGQRNLLGVRQKPDILQVNRGGGNQGSGVRWIHIDIDTQTHQYPNHNHTHTCTVYMYLLQHGWQCANLHRGGESRHHCDADGGLQVGVCDIGVDFNFNFSWVGIYGVSIAIDSRIITLTTPIVTPYTVLLAQLYEFRPQLLLPVLDQGEDAVVQILGVVGVGWGVGVVTITINITMSISDYLLLLLLCMAQIFDELRVIISTRHEHVHVHIRLGLGAIDIAVVIGFVAQQFRSQSDIESQLIGLSLIIITANPIVLIHVAYTDPNIRG